LEKPALAAGFFVGSWRRPAAVDAGDVICYIPADCAGGGYRAARLVARANPMPKAS